MSNYTKYGPDGSAGDDPFRDAGGPPRPGEPGYERYRSRPYDFYGPYPNPEVDALKAYRDQLAFTVDEEGRFLAKMWALAKECNLHKEYEALLGTAMKLRPDKVLAAARVLSNLGNIYEAVHSQADESWSTVYLGRRWTGDFADQFDAYFSRLIRYADQDGTHTLYTIAKDTSKTLEVFGLALQKWRNDMATAIKAASELDAETEKKLAEAVASGAYDVAAGKNPAAVATAILKAMISIWSAIDSEAKKKKDGLERLAKELNIPIKLPEDKYIDELHIQFDNVPSGRLT